MRASALTLVLASLAAPGAAHAAVPSATTGAPESVRAAAFIATGTVDPGGVDTTARVEYGIGPLLSSHTADQPVGAGAGAVAITVPVSGLVPATKYGYRVVATNTEGTANGEVRNVVTAARSTSGLAPTAATKPPTETQPTVATLAATVNPRGLATRYAFEFGATPALGSRTAEATLAASRGALPVARQITGLAAGSRYYYRVVAANSAGTVQGIVRSLLTPRGLVSVVLRRTPPLVAWNTELGVGGRVTGQNVRGTRVVLERQDSPFTAPFRASKERTTDSEGAFAFPLGRLRAPVRYRIATKGGGDRTVSAPVTVGTRVAVDLRIQRRAPRKVILTGSVRPGVGRGRVLVQRLKGSTWVTVGRAKVRRVSATRSRAKVVVTRRSKAVRVRLLALPRPTTRVASAASRAVLISRRSR